jgi:hypothetical protein
MAKGDRPAFSIKAVPKDRDTKGMFDVGCIFVRDNRRMSLAPSLKADENAKYPKLKFALLDEMGTDVTEEFWINVYDNREL